MPETLSYLKYPNEKSKLREISSPNPKFKWLYILHWDDQTVTLLGWS